MTDSFPPGNVIDKADAIIASERAKAAQRAEIARHCAVCSCGGLIHEAGKCKACIKREAQKLTAYHRAEAAKFHCKERDDSEKYGSKYIVGVADWHGKLLPAVFNTETGLTSEAMSRTFAQRRCRALNYHEFTKTEGAATHIDCDDAKLLRRLHGVST